MKNKYTKLLLSILIFGAVSCGGEKPVFPVYDITDKVGFISATGSILVEPAYEKAGEMEKGLIPVRKDIPGEDGKEQKKWGYINRTGKEIIPFEYDEAASFSESLATVIQNKKCGYIGLKGETIIPLEFTDCGPFRDGLAAVKKDNLYGYIDNTGKSILPSTLEWAGDFGSALAPFRQKNQYGFLDKTGKTVIEPKYSKARSFVNGFAAVSQKGKFGFIDSAGKEITKLEYDEVKDFSDGLAAVKQKKKWGFVNTSGALVVPLEYEEVIPFSEGLATVRKNRLWGYIDSTGKVVQEIKHHGARPFNNGLGSLYTKEGKKIYIDKNFKEIYSFQIPRVGTYTRFATDYAGWLSESFYVKLKDNGSYTVSYTVLRNTFGRTNTDASEPSIHWTEKDGVVTLRFSNGITATGWFSPFGEYINFNRHEDDAKFFFKKRDREFY